MPHPTGVVVNAAAAGTYDWFTRSTVDRTEEQRRCRRAGMSIGGLSAAGTAGGILHERRRHMSKRRWTIGLRLEALSEAVTRWAGGTRAFATALSVIIVWAALGPVFHYSDTWQLVINTGTTIVTFLMVFLIQRSQNKDALALHLKLNELVAAIEGASNRLIEVEALTERDLTMLRSHYQELAKLAREEVDVTRSHSVEEARSRHRSKTRTRGKR
jgi:low affinity Fe/Cu permease